MKFEKPNEFIIDVYDIINFLHKQTFKEKVVDEQNLSLPGQQCKGKNY
jgi:hypothetical protein